MVRAGRGDKTGSSLGIDNSILYRPLVRGLYAGRGDKTGSSLGIDNSILSWVVVSMLVEVTKLDPVGAH